jgi:hypothetical protein
MKTVDFGKYNANGAQVVKESGALAAGEEVLVTWTMPDVCASGNLIVTQPQQNGDTVFTTKLNDNIKTSMTDMTFQFGDKVLVPNSSQSATTTVERATKGLLFKLTV